MIVVDAFMGWEGAGRNHSVDEVGGGMSLPCCLYPTRTDSAPPAVNIESDCPGSLINQRLSIPSPPLPVQRSLPHFAVFPTAQLRFSVRGASAWQGVCEQERGSTQPAPPSPTLIYGARDSRQSQAA